MSVAKRNKWLKVLKKFGESKPGVLRRVVKGAYDSTTGDYLTKTNQGQVCQAVQISDGISSENLKLEIAQDTVTIIIALDEVLIAYDANWAETSRASSAPFAPDQFNKLDFNGNIYKIIEINNLDALTGGVFQARCKKFKI